LRQKKIQLKSTYTALKQDHTKLEDRLVQKNTKHKGHSKKVKELRRLWATDSNRQDAEIEDLRRQLVAAGAWNTADVYSANNQYKELKRSHDELHNGNDALWKRVEASEAQRDKAPKRQHELAASCEEQDRESRVQDDEINDLQDEIRGLKQNMSHADDLPLNR
jgi:hypothetical protein